VVVLVSPAGFWAHYNIATCILTYLQREDDASQNKRFVLFNEQRLDGQEEWHGTRQK